MSKYLYFKNSRTEDYQLPEGLSVKVVPLDSSCLYRRLWWISAFINGGQLLEYKLFRGDKSVSSAVVTPKVWNLAFMKKDELQIGPCRTEPDERGKGYYPTLLNYIMSQNLGKNHVMMVAESNAPSVRGVEKAGFVQYAKGHKTKLHRFVIERNMNGTYNTTFRLRKGIWADAGEPSLFVSVGVTDCKSMLNGGGYLVENIYDFDCKEETAAWFVIKDSFGGMEELSSNMRNQVRKSLKTFEIKRITNEYLAENGYEVFKAAELGYGLKEGSFESEEVWKRNTLNTDRELWGAICKENGQLAAYGENHVTEFSCGYRVLKADPAYRKQYAYYGLIYEMNRHYLEKRGLKYVNDGFRSLTEHSNIQPFLIEKFKFRKAYCKTNVSAQVPLP